MRLRRIKRLRKLINFGRQRKKVEIRIKVKNKMTKTKESSFCIRKDNVITKGMKNINALYQRRRPKVNVKNVESRFFNF